MSDAKKVRASGRGLQPSGVRVGDVADFKIYTEGAGEGSPEVRVIGPGTCTFCQAYKRSIFYCSHGYISLSRLLCQKEIYCVQSQLR